MRADVRHKVAKVISGGQTGADLGALRGARAIGLKTGGFVPKFGRNEEAPRNQRLLKLYGLVELETHEYRPRTLRNIMAADATIIFGDLSKTGSQLTYNLAYGKRPVLVNPCPDTWLRWLAAGGYTIINIAGNRESGNPGIEEYVYRRVVEDLGSVKEEPMETLPRLIPGLGKRVG